MTRFRFSSVDRPLWGRIVALNLVVFAAGTAVLAFSPATVSSQPVLSEVVILLVGLALLGVTNAWVVHNLVSPLDRLAAQLDREWAADPAQRFDVPARGVARRLTRSVNNLFARIEEGQRQAAAAALAAEEAERARVAQELHDGVGQSLTAILLEAGMLAESEQVTPADAARLRDAARASLAEVRAVARKLRPHVLEDLGLRSALAALTQDLFSHGPTLVTRNVDAVLPDLEDGTEVVVFRIAQEALTNVARHADAASVEVRLQVVGERLELTVTDDGRGLLPDATGTGLRGMAERAALVGGAFHTRRPPGGTGTEVHLSVPVPPTGVER